MRQERGRERESQRERERGRERKREKEKGIERRSLVAALDTGRGRVIRQPGPLVRLRAAKLTRSSVYTLIATPRLRNPLRRHRVTGHRARTPRCGVGFLFLPSSRRAGRVHANEAEVRPTLHVRSRNGVYVRHERTSTSISPDPPFAHRAHRRRFSCRAGKKEESRARAGFPATDRPVAGASRSDVFIGKGRS